MSFKGFMNKKEKEIKYLNGIKKTMNNVFQHTSDFSNKLFLNNLISILFLNKKTHNFFTFFNNFTQKIIKTYAELDIKIRWF